jgi:hypothetical protein
VRNTRSLALVAIIALSLVGCTATDAPPTPSLTPPAALLNPELQPLALSAVTAETTRVEGTRIGDALQALIDPALILNVDDKSQVVPVDDDLPAYYAVFRTISFDTSVDCLALAETLATVLGQSGWVIEQSTNQDGIYVAAISGGTADAPWFILLGGDASQVDQSVVTVQIASPDIVE